MRTELMTDWSAPLGAFPAELRDVYYTPEYLALHSAEGTPTAFVVSEGEHRLIVSGMRVPIGDAPATAFDLQSPNGYGGPLVSPDAAASFVEAAWAAWREAASAEGVVAAFFRLHPLLENRRALPADAKIVTDRQTVFVDLAGGLDAAWQGAESRFRNMVNRGRKAGIQLRWNEPQDWVDFEALYMPAMVRLNAPPRLRFDSKYFNGLRALPGVELVCSRDDEGLVAGHIFLWGPVWGHYHLAARREDAPNFTMNLLMQAGFERAAARGLKGVHLGGGASAAPDDGVLKFKRSHGGALRDFDVALVIADADRYRDLLDEWARAHGSAPSWLLGYRQPPARLE